MSGGRRSVSIIIQRDGALQSSSYRIPLWAVRAALILGVGITVLLVLGVAFYGPIARQAARVPPLEREVDRLRTDNLRVRALAAAMDSVEVNYERLRTMVGADIVPDPVILSSSVPVAPSLMVTGPDSTAVYEIGSSPPRHWPLDERGYVTRGQALADTAQEDHPGIDIAVPVGSIVRASGGGIVLQTGEQAQYGRFVLLEHPDGYQSMYGHLSRVIAVQGARVNAGEVIARSGNTGRSSAPHLHFEIRLNGVSIDPGTMVKEEH
ncbi:MAG TPA: M23 family metallopeptidase [Gemmatimonadales bacterium]|jgi:murein DD-endopeptidase MepM/ murein hydrolase activator NlpD|nr:M23 family metallopeptidase [Gemmatimonadales bacterium]